MSVENPAASLAFACGLSVCIPNPDKYVIFQRFSLRRVGLSDSIPKWDTKSRAGRTPALRAI